MAVNGPKPSCAWWVGADSVPLCSSGVQLWRGKHEPQGHVGSWPLLLPYFPGYNPSCPPCPPCGTQHSKEQRVREDNHYRRPEQQWYCQTPIHDSNLLTKFDPLMYVASLSPPHKLGDLLEGKQQALHFLAWRDVFLLCSSLEHFRFFLLYAPHCSEKYSTLWTLQHMSQGCQLVTGWAVSVMEGSSTVGSLTTRNGRVALPSAAPQSHLVI